MRPPYGDPASRLRSNLGQIARDYRARLRSPGREFHSWHYLRHTQRRQEHLASLELPLANRTVVEVGAGIGDHTQFFLDRGCEVVITEARSENMAVLRKRFPSSAVRTLDLDDPDLTLALTGELVYCYGTLYHLSRPAEALEYLAGVCTDLLLLETCVSHGSGRQVNIVAENRGSASQAVSGRGCRPTRDWVFGELQRHFPFVYMSRTQPWHPEFPLDWSAPIVPGVRRSSLAACHGRCSWRRARH